MLRCVKSGCEKDQIYTNRSLQKILITSSQEVERKEVELRPVTAPSSDKEEKSEKREEKPEKREKRGGKREKREQERGGKLEDSTLPDLVPADQPEADRTLRGNYGALFWVQVREDIISQKCMITKRTMF